MQTLTEPERISLYYRQGGSDKVYHVAIEPSGKAGFVVNFAYGRRGATLQTGTKTSSPVDYPAAKKIYDKLVREKTAKGYTPGEDAHTVSTDRQGESSHRYPPAALEYDRNGRCPALSLGSQLVCPGKAGRQADPGSPGWRSD